MLLMKSELPITNTVSFKRNSKTKKIDWKALIIDKPEKQAGNILGYRVPCNGDSGSGQIFSTNYNELRFVIAAVYNANSPDDVRDRDGKPVGMPCGAYSINVPYYKILETVHFSESLSWPDIFDWIKDTLKK